MAWPVTKPPKPVTLNAGQPPGPSAAAAPMPVFEENPEPREGRQFPCNACGAAMKFLPGGEELHCEHCGNRRQIPREAAQVQENCFKTYFNKAAAPTEPIPGIVGERRCDGCGAMVQIPLNVATEECPFCGTHLHNPVTVPQPVIAPAGVLPFRVTDQQAKGSFKTWVGSRWFAPNAFKRAADLGRINGLYVPYWTYDAMTWSFFVGERGDHYWVTVGSGKNQRRVRKTRWSSASGRVDHFFDDVLVCASDTLPGALTTSLEPWDLKDAVPFKQDYLAGFRTERYRVGAPEGFVVARTIMDDAIRSMVKRRIGGDEQRIHSINTQVDGVTFKHLLLPIWLSAYRFKDRTFRVLINARTGEVQGERPYSAIKIAFATLAGLVVFGFILYMILQGNAPQ